MAVEKQWNYAIAREDNVKLNEEISGETIYNLLKVGH